MAKYFSIDQVIIHNTYKSYYEIASKLLIDDKSTNVLSQSNPDNHLISLYSGDFKYYNVDLIDFMQQKFNKFKGIPGITYNLKKHHIQFLSKINAIDLFTSIEKTPLYNILIKLEKNQKPDSKIKLLDFYLYIHNNYFYLLNELDQLLHFIIMIYLFPQNLIHGSILILYSNLKNIFMIKELLHLLKHLKLIFIKII